MKVKYCTDKDIGISSSNLWGVPENTKVKYCTDKVFLILNSIL